LKKVLSLFIKFSTISFCFASDSDYRPYIIKEGDNVSEILFNKSLAPLYGSKSWIEKVLKLNRLTLVTSKKLEPGDVIILPLKSFVTSDEIKTMKSSWKKDWENSLETKFLAPKKHTFSIVGGYFVRDFDFKSEGKRVTTNQNFSVAALYKKRKTVSIDRYSFNPIAQIKMYTQSNADFSSDNSMVAEFNPSYQVKAAIEIEDRQSRYSLILASEIENFSVITANAQNYNIKQATLWWNGIVLKKRFNYRKSEYYLNAGFAIGHDYDAHKVNLAFGSIYKSHYRVEVFANREDFSFKNDMSIASLGLNFGYSF
jgi:hypothetical protein